MSIKDQKVSIQSCKERAEEKEQLEFRPATRESHVETTCQSRTLIYLHVQLAQSFHLHLLIRMLRLVRRTAATTTVRTYARMSAPISLEYTHDRASDLKENIAAVQQDVDHAAGTGAKVCTEMHKTRRHAN